MIIYLTCFIGTILLLIASRKVKKSQRWFLELFALLIPCLLAAFRANTVGTDVRVYLEPMTFAAIYSDSFHEFLAKSWFQSWHYVSPSDYEIGFVLLVYIVAKLFHNIFSVQFFVQLFAILPTYIALKKLYRGRERFVWLGMLVYFFMYYHRSLNAMRQSIAMAFLLLSYANMETNHRRGVYACILISVLFHKSAVIGILIYLIYNFVLSGRIKNFRIFHYRISGYYLNMYLVIIFAFFVLFGVGAIITILRALGLSRYVNYIDGSLKFMPNQIISRLPILALFYFVWKQKNEAENFRFLFAVFCIDLILSQLTSINSFAGRIGYYFSQFSIVNFPALYKSSGCNKKVILFLLAYLNFYWFYYFVYNAFGQTVPYVFGI